MKPTHHDTEMHDAAEDDRQRRARDGTAGAVPEGEGRRGERPRESRGFMSPRVGDSSRAETSRASRAYTYRPSTPPHEWQYKGEIIVHTSGCDICRNYWHHYSDALFDDSNKKAREARDRDIMNQRSTTLQEDLQWYRSQRDLAWAERDGLQRELELTLDRLDDAQTEIGEQMARADRLQRALNGYNDEDRRYRKRPRGDYSSTGSRAPTRDTSVNDGYPAYAGRYEDRGRSPEQRPPPPMAEEEHRPAPGLSEKAKGKMKVPPARSPSPPPRKKRSRHQRRKCGDTDSDFDSESASEGAGKNEMDVDDDVPPQGNQPRADPTFPVPRDAYGVSPDIGTRLTRPWMPYPPAKEAPPPQASYAAAAAVPAPNTGNFPMAEWPFEHKYYKLVLKMAKEPGNWEAIKWMKRASTWAHTEMKPRNKLQSLILYTWKMPAWATGLIDAGDPSVPPGIKDSRRRAKSRRSEVPPPAAAAGVEASASNPNIVPGSNPVTIGGNTITRIPPQGSPPLDASIEEHATWLYNNPAARNRERVPIINGAISMIAVRGYMLVRRLLPPRSGNVRIQSELRRHIQLLLMELIAEGRGYENRLAKANLRFITGATPTPLTEVTLNTSLDDLVLQLAQRGVDPALLDEAHHWALQWITAERKDPKSRFANLHDLWVRITQHNYTAKWPGVTRKDVALWFRPARVDAPRMVQPDLPLEAPLTSTILDFRTSQPVASGSNPAAASTELASQPVPPNTAPSSGGNNIPGGPTPPPADVQQMDPSPDSSGEPAIGEVPDLSGVSLDDNVPATSLDSSSVLP